MISPNKIRSKLLLVIDNEIKTKSRNQAVSNDSVSNTFKINFIESFSSSPVEQKKKHQSARLSQGCELNHSFSFFDHKSSKNYLKELCNQIKRVKPAHHPHLKKIKSGNLSHIISHPISCKNLNSCNTCYHRRRKTPAMKIPLLSKIILLNQNLAFV